ncbi:hypothetical protein [Rossellomorea vietnamensis]|uniref:hypothetical protein n=1 Tax=Rossellomorea vietnamensis TaxID=218284 RepID=UPI0005599CEF|nr:hypothetical protein [Rossellomorea vietnamensis]
MKSKIRCHHCKEFYQPEDKVALNYANTILHFDCPDTENLPIIDEGTFEEIVKKYSFFSDTLLN